MNHQIEENQTLWAGFLSFLWKAALTIGSSATVSAIFKWGLSGFATVLSMVISYLVFNRIKNYLRNLSYKKTWLKEWLHKPIEGEDQTNL